MMTESVLNRRSRSAGARFSAHVAKLQLVNLAVRTLSVCAVHGRVGYGQKSSFHV